MPGLRKTSRRSNKDNKNKTRVRKQKKRRTQRQNKRQKRTLKGGSNMNNELNRLRRTLSDEKLMTNKSTQDLRTDLMTLGLNEALIDTVLESINILSTLDLNEEQKVAVLKSINNILKKKDSVSDKINAVQEIIKHAQETYGTK